MEDALILSQSEYARLLEEIHQLQARITVLTALRDDLVYHVCPALQAEYDEKIVSLERELMAASLYLHQLQRTIEILQAQMNQQQEPSMDEAEAQAKQENKQYEEELHRKAEEAREFRKKWEESQWSRYDRQDREAGRTRDRAEGNGEGSEKSSGTDDDQKSGTDQQGTYEGRKSGTDQQETYEGQKSGTDQKETHDDQNSGTDQQDSDDDRKPGTEETAAQKIKRLYRKIVKRLHPDVHPNPTEHEKDLLNQAMAAFREGNLQLMERIWDELSGMDAPEDMFDDTPEGREKLREMLEKLKARVHFLELEIEHIKMDFPYKMKAFLEDPEAVEQVRSGIQSKIDNVREMNRQLEALINELKEKMRKGERL